MIHIRHINRSNLFVEILTLEIKSLSKYESSLLQVQEVGFIQYLSHVTRLF